jgi:hypothetical protein
MDYSDDSCLTEVGLPLLLNENLLADVCVLSSSLLDK